MKSIDISLSDAADAAAFVEEDGRLSGLAEETGFDNEDGMVAAGISE